MKRSNFVVLVIGAVLIIFGCSGDYLADPELSQSNATSASMAKMKKVFTGTSKFQYLHEDDAPKITELPNGKKLMTGRISVYYDDVSDQRVKGLSIWYVTALIAEDGSARIGGDAKLIVDDDGGIWEMKWHGQKAADGSIVAHAFGTGIEGAVKGLSAKWIYTRPVGKPGYYDVKGLIIGK